MDRIKAELSEGPATPACDPNTDPSELRWTPLLGQSRGRIKRERRRTSSDASVLERCPGRYSVRSARQTVWRETPKVIATPDWDCPLRRSRRMAAV